MTDCPANALPTRLVAGSDLAGLIDFCWRTMFDLRDCVEDVEGADGRLENLLALRWKMLVVIQSIEASVSAEFGHAAEEMHRVAYLFQHGAPTLNFTANELIERVCLNHPKVLPIELHDALLTLGNDILDRLPGHLPAALGATGQRELIRAMRMWSEAAKSTDADLDFLAERFESLAG